MKEHFASKHFASKHFASGHFVGVGISIDIPSLITMEDESFSIPSVALETLEYGDCGSEGFIFGSVSGEELTRMKG